MREAAADGPSIARLPMADLADRHGSGTIRLTVWQNLLISGVSDDHVALGRLRLKTALVVLRTGGFSQALRWITSGSNGRVARLASRRPKSGRPSRAAA